MTDKYILIGREAVPCDDLLEWATWFEEFDRRIAHDFIGRQFEVSTIFLGLDFNVARLFNPKARPLLFETIAFSLNPDGSRRDNQAQERCSTYDEAEAQHRDIVDRLTRAARG